MCLCADLWVGLQAGVKAGPDFGWLLRGSAPAVEIGPRRLLVCPGLAPLPVARGPPEAQCRRHLRAWRRSWPTTLAQLLPLHRLCPVSQVDWCTPQTVLLK